MSIELSLYVAESGTTLVAEPASGSPLVQSVRTDPTTLLTLTAVSGTVGLQVNGGTAHDLPAQSLGSAIQSALAADAALSGWSVSVTGNGPYTIALSRTTAPADDPLPEITADAASLTTALPTNDGAQVTSMTPSDAWLGYGSATEADWSGVSIPLPADRVSNQGCYYAPAGGHGTKWTTLKMGGVPSAGLVTVKASLYSQAYLDTHTSLGTLATAARYHFYDGETLATATYRGSAVLNQSTAVTGASNDWVNLRNVYCASGTIIVLIKDDATAGGPILVQQLRVAAYTPTLAEPSDTVPSASATTSLVGGGIPYITINGGDPIELTLVWTDPNQADALNFVFARIPQVQESDVVRAWINGDVVRFDSGSNAAVAGAIVRNSVGTPVLPDPLEGDRTARLGFQPGNGGAFQPGDPWANRLKNANFGWTGGNADPYTLVGGLSAIQLPLDQSETRQRLLTQVYYQPNYTTLVKGRYTCLPFGIHHAIVPGADGTITGTGVTITPQAGSVAGHRIVDIQPSDDTSDIRIYLQLDQTSHLATAAPAVYGPEIEDPLNPPYWDPHFIRQMSSGGKAKLCRTKDLDNLDNNCSVTHPDDLPTRSWASYQIAPERWRMNVVSIDQAPEGAWNRSRGRGAAATATVSGGKVTTIAVTSGGVRYDTAPRVILSGGGGSGATAHAVLGDGGAVTSVVVDTQGTGYGSAPTVSFAAPPRMRVNFATDHPYSNGQFVYVQVPDGNGYCSYRFDLNFADGSTGTVAVGGLVYVLDARSIILQGYTDLYDGSKDYHGKALGTTSPVGVFTAIQLCSPPAEDAYDLASELGDDCVIWKDLPHCVTPEGAYAFGQVAAEHYPLGRRLVMGLSNEPWNPAFPQFFAFLTEGIEYFYDPPSSGESWPHNDDGTPNAWECAAWAFALKWLRTRYEFTRGWVDSGRDPADPGRDPADLIWEVNVPPYGGSWLAQVLLYISTHDREGRRSTDVGYLGAEDPPDVACVAMYYSIYGTNSALASEYGAMTVPQTADYGDAYVRHFRRTLLGIFDASLKATIANSPYPDLAVASYEGGAQSICFSQDQARNDAMTIAYFNHPRYPRNYLTVVRELQGLGYDLQIKTFSATVIIKEYDGAWRARMYPSFLGTDSVSGVGDGSDGKADNREFIVDSDGNPAVPAPTDLVSVGAYALEQWVAAPDVVADPAVVPWLRRPGPRGRGRLIWRVPVQVGRAWHR